jgi:hypothetical protein
MASHHLHRPDAFEREDPHLLRPHRPGMDAPTAARPVFVDRSGRRRRLFTLLGAGFGVLLLIGLIAVAASFFSGGPAQLPGWPGQGGAAQLKPSAVEPTAQPQTTTAAPGMTASLSPTPKKATTTAAPPGQTNTHKPTAKPSNTRRP